MIRGLYTSGMSMLANNKKMDVISNNMANVSTNGFKRDIAVFESFPDVLTKRLNDTPSRTNPMGDIGTMSMGHDVGQVYTVFSQGQMMKTGSSLDVAITGAPGAFFTLARADANGNPQIYYTRNGAFSLNSQGQLVTADGLLVMGENGPVELQTDDFSVGNDGTVMVGGQVIDRLRIVQFDNTELLQKVGENLLAAPQGTVPGEFTGSVEQGMLEGSNVNIVREMVDMITVMRAYEANQKIIQAQDSTLEKAVNEVGAVR